MWNPLLFDTERKYISEKLGYSALYNAKNIEGILIFASLSNWEISRITQESYVVDSLTNFIFEVLGCSPTPSLSHGPNRINSSLSDHNIFMVNDEDEDQ